MTFRPEASTAGPATGLLHWLASPRWMLAFFVFAAASALVSIYQPEWITAAWALPLAIFALSLLAAVATNRRFRRDAALLGLHLGLLAFVVLVALSRLTYLDGVVTLSEGDSFEGVLHLDQRGPLHPGEIEHQRFTNEGFTENFDPRASWKATYNRVSWQDAVGARHVAEIGDDYPLVVDGYRIYTTRNRGYSPVFRWEPKTGPAETGTVQLRPGELDQANSWQLPGGQEIWAILEVDGSTELQPGEQRPNLGAAALPHRIVIRTGERREALRPGEHMTLPEGRLTYVGLDSWMGYHVVYDPAMYWMVAAAAVVVVCMIWFYARLLLRRGTGTEEKAQGEVQCV